MPIGNSYPRDVVIEDADLFLGTKASLNNTVNYTAQGIANYLNINGKVSITGQMSFKFVEINNITKTISFEGGGGNNTPFSNITQLIVSKSDLSGQQVEIFLAYLNGKEILLAHQNEINSFGNYKITGYTVTIDPGFYTLDLEFIGGNGVIIKNSYYDMVAFSSSTGGTPYTLPIASLTILGGVKIGTGVNIAVDGVISVSTDYQAPLSGSGIVNSTSGVISYISGASTQYIAGDGSLVTFPSLTEYVPFTGSTTDVVLGGQLGTSQLNLWDTSGLAYSSILASNAGFSLFNFDGDTIIKAKLGSLTFSTSGGGPLIFSEPLTTPSAALTYTLPNASGTIALTTDLPIVGTWGALNYPTWTTGTPFVKMTAAGTFALDTSTYLTTAVTSVATTGLISGGTITSTGTISTSMNTGKLVGRYSSGTGIMQEITVGSGLTLTGAGILNNTATATPLGYYGAFQDVTNQTAAAINTGYPMKLGITDLSNGVTVVSNSRITIANTGIYNIQWSAQFTNPLSSEHDVTIWLRKNGVDVPGSAGIVLVPAKHGSADGHTLPSWNFLLDVVAGDYYEFVWSTVNTSVYISFQPAGTPPPSTASVVMTVTQQSGIMAGTGITAINSLTGAAQTLTVGTAGTDFAIVDSGVDHKFNLPTASAANRGALSSTDWSTFNNKQNALGYTPIKSVVKDTVQGTTITGVTTETLTGTYLIPANTFATNDIMKITSFLAERTTIVNTITLRVKIGSTNVFSNSTLIASTYLTGTNTSVCLQRFNIMIRSGILRVISPATILSNDCPTNPALYSNITFNPAVDNYIFTSLQLSSILDSVFQSNFIATN